MEEGVIRDEEMEGLEEEKKKIESYLLADNYFSTFSPPMRVNDLYPVNLEEVTGALADTETSDILDEMDSFETGEMEGGRLSIDEAAMNDIEDSVITDDIIREKKPPLCEDGFLSENKSSQNAPFCRSSFQDSKVKREVCEENLSKESLEIKLDTLKVEVEDRIETSFQIKAKFELAESKVPAPSVGLNANPAFTKPLPTELDSPILNVVKAKTSLTKECAGGESPPPSDIVGANSPKVFSPEGPPMDTEEGELEEGELTDEESQEQLASLTKETKVESGKLLKEETKEATKTEKTKAELKEVEKNNKIEGLEKKEKSEHKKRKHKEKEEESENSQMKKRKHHFAPEEDSEGGRKKVTIREKPLDFDTLLKRQMYLVGSSSNPENMFPHEENFEHNQYRGECDSYESGSGDEWGEGVKPIRRRVPRKRRGGSRSPSRKNEAICMFYLQGSCKRGGDCPYSHDIAPTRKMELCKFYMMDCCAKREKCLYMHKDFPCKYYHFGIKCKDGDICKFSHDPLQDIVKNILIKHIELAPKDILGDFPRLTKRSAQIILLITEAKRIGEPIDNELLEKVSENEGKGFRYLDRAMKNLRKKKDGDRAPKIGGDKEKEEDPPKVREQEEKEEERDRSKETLKSKEREHKEKEKSPKKSKNYDKEGRRERAKDKKERGKERDNRRRDREKGTTDEKGVHIRGDKVRRDRHRSDSIRGPSKGDDSFETPFKLKDPFAEMTPKQRELSSRLEDRRMPQDYGIRGSSDRNSSLGGTNYPIGEDPYPTGDDSYLMQDTRWYSSDEEVDPNRSPLDGRRDSFTSPQGGRKQRLGDSSWGGLGNQGQNMQQGGHGHSQSEGHPPTSFLDQPNLSNIDFSYLKNVLNTVQNQTCQNKTPIQNAPQDSNPNSWGDRKRHASSGFSSRERSVNNYMDMADDIKEVFYDSPEPNEPRTFSRNLDSFIHSAREMSTSNEPVERSFSKLENRASPSLRSSRDSQDSVIEGSPWKQRDITDPRLKSGSFPKEDSLSSDSNTPFGITPKNPVEYVEGDVSPNSRDKVHILKKDSDIKTRSSIYDLGYGLQDSIQSPDYDEGSDHLPFKVPVHASAKEIDGSINMHSPIEYRLVLVTVPKPDFSKLKINKNDPKTFEDPRLKMMLRRPSNEECSRSPRGAPVVNDVDQPNFGSPLIDPKVKVSSKINEIESRDPRKSTSRDPRADPRVDPRTDPRGDPRTDLSRLDSRSDPRLDNRNNTISDPRKTLLDPRADSWVDPRIDPRMVQRPDQRGLGGRMDPRDSLLGPDLMETDPRVGGPVFTNGLMDGSGFGNFGGISNHSSMLPQNIDPRGRPGLLGAGPSPNSMAMGPIGQSLNPSAFLLQSTIGHQGGPFMQRDRGDMMGGPGPNFSQGQGWGGGRSHFNDPRLGSNGDFPSPMS